MGVVLCVRIFFSDTTAALRAAEILVKFFPHNAVQWEGPAGQWLVGGAPGAFAACHGVCCHSGLVAGVALWYVLRPF